MKSHLILKETPLKVLILEDSLLDLELMTGHLSAAGYQLDVTHTEEKAGFREALKGKKYDIILSDFKLPGFDAFGALEICKEICPETPFICVSGSIGEETAIDLLKKGAVDYVLKDRPARLPYAVQYALEKASEKAALDKIAQGLKESENRFRQVAESAQEWIWEVDTNGMYTYASPVIELLLGYTPDEVVGKKYFYDFFIPEKREEFKQAAFELFAKRENLSDFENTLLHKNSQLVIASTNGSPVFDEDGNFKGYRGVDEDITKRILAEKKLIQNQYYLTKAQEMGRIGSWEIDLKKNELFWTEQNYINFGVPLGTPLTYETFLDCIHPDEKEYVNAEWMAAINGKPYDIEHRLIVGGEVRWVREKADVEFDDSKKAIKAIGFTQDTTELKQTEEKIREKDLQFRKLSANVPDLIYQFTRKPDGTYFVPVASEGIKNIFGCSPEDVIDDFAPIARVIFPEDSERVIHDIEYSAEQLTSFTCEFRVQIPGKPIQWILSRSTPEKLPDGSITWYGFNTDITSRKQAENALLAKMNELERFHKLTVGREITMVELKKEINNLLNKLGQDNKYKIVE